MELMADLLFRKQTAEVIVVVQERVGVTDGQDNLDLAQFRQLPAAMEPRQEVRRRMEIDRIIVIAVKQIAADYASANIPGS